MSMEINWFPGHMAKTRRLIEDALPLVDIVVETCDARIPISSRNPDLAKQIDGKKHLLLLTKKDLADDTKTQRSLEILKSDHGFTLAVDLFKSTDIRLIRRNLEILGRDFVQKAIEKGRLTRSLRVMVVGIPNSGKSTLINQLAKKKAAKVEDRPGVTRSRQWIKTEDNFELLDMPGILWPNLGEWSTKLHLAMTGAIKDEILDQVELAYHAANTLVDLYPDYMLTRFGKNNRFLPNIDNQNWDENYLRDDIMLHWQRFEAMARNRNCIRKGNQVDEERFAKLLLNEFRNGLIGRISLEQVS